MHTPVGTKRIRQAMKHIAEIHNIDLIYDTVNEVKDKSWSTRDGKTIGIGVYDNIELEYMSFFHELAHCIYSEKEFENRFQEEIYMTLMAIQYARNNRLATFSDNAIIWMLEQTLSYKKYDY